MSQVPELESGQLPAGGTAGGHRRLTVRAERRRRGALARAGLGRVGAGPAAARAAPAGSPGGPPARAAWVSPPDLFRRLTLHSCVVLLALATASGELLGGWSRLTEAQPRAGGPIITAPPELAGEVPGEAVASVAAAAAFTGAPAQPVAPDLRRPVELVDAYQATHALAPGETLGAVAARYGISLETLVWANGLERGDALALGQALRIPRVSGAPDWLGASETVGDLALRHGVPIEAILTFAPNRLAGGGSPGEGAQIYVPGSRRELPPALLEAFGGLAGLAERSAVPVGVVRDAQTNLRAGPTTDHERVAQLGPGRQVELRARHREWLRVRLGGVEGWVRSDLLLVAEGLVGELPESSDFPPPPPRWVWPARGAITSRFGPRWGGFHNGLDIANRAWTTIVAARSGVVREAGWCRGYGYCVKIRHSGGMETIYGHLIDRPVVSAGDEVAAGEVIGYMGSTYDRAGGGYSTGVHLHFTVYLNGRAVDPLRFLP